ncbi:CDK5RAP1-like protein [Brevipalpus obovatus]|uniref:CDK5RAP1-like protein n=1 Tax=Brevipalpus obovatus TaxID=246614 RepID=UPI003D9F4A1B
MVPSGRFCVSVNRLMRRSLCGHRNPFGYFSLARLSSAPTTEKIDQLRHKIQNGPHLKDFITATGPSNEPPRMNLESDGPFIAKRNESLPYLPENYLDGGGLKVHIETYGCQMNVNDSQIAAKLLNQYNYQIVEEWTSADIIILMTCAIRDSAETKIWARLRELKQFKLSGHLKQIGVIGCMAERLKTKLIEKHSFVDVVAGPDNYRDLPKLLAINNITGTNAVNTLLSLDETYADVMPVVVLGHENKVNLNNWSQFKKGEAIKAFVSIMRGCNNMCSYCIVPFTRGRERSRPVESIVEEVRLLSAAGCKEITLLGQNVNSYCDTHLINDEEANEHELAEGFTPMLKTKPTGLTFDTLLEKVASIDPEIRIRFTSPHPKDFPTRVLNVIKKYPNICKSIHLPAQSGDDQILARMRRGYTKKAYLDLVTKFREILPNVALTSDFICGFCDETEDAHKETLDLIDRVKFQFAYIFAYSMRERTHAHYRLEDNVPREIKVRRVTEALDLFHKHSLTLNVDKIGQQNLVLVDGISSRSNLDLSGRDDANVNVIFERRAIPVGSINGSTTREPIPGDYVCTETINCNSKTLVARPLYLTSLSEFNSR